MSKNIIGMEEEEEEEEEESLEKLISNKMMELCSQTRNWSELVHDLKSSVEGLGGREFYKITHSPHQTNYDRNRQLYETILKYKMDYGELKKMMIRSGNEHIVDILDSSSFGKNDTPSDSRRGSNLSSFRRHSLQPSGYLRPLLESSNSGSSGSGSGSMPPIFEPKNEHRRSESFAIHFNIEDPIKSFQGRSEFLKKFHASLQQEEEDSDQNSSPGINRHGNLQIIMGEGGLGKTEFVKKYIKQYASYYTHIVWFEMDSGMEKFKNSITTLADNRHLQIYKMTPEGQLKSVEILVMEIFSKLFQKKSLIIFDGMNNNTVTSFDQRWEGIEFLKILTCPFSSAKETPCVIVTSQNFEWDSNLASCTMVTMAPLTEEESREFIEKELCLTDEKNDEFVPKLSNLLGGNPSALHQVVSYLKKQNFEAKKWGKTPSTVEDCVKLLDIIQQPSDGFKFPSAFRTLYDTWDPTLSAVGSSDAGEMVLRLAAMMAFMNTPKAFFLAGIPNEHLHTVGRRGFRRLDTKSMIETSSLDSGYGPAEEEEDEDVEERRTMEQVQGIILDKLKLNQFEKLDESLKTLETACRSYFRASATISEARDDMIAKVIKIGRNPLALQILQTLNDKRGGEGEGSSSGAGKDHNFVVAIKEIMGDALCSQEMYEEAIDWYVKALQIQARHLEPSHPNILTTIEKLADILYHVGNYGEAIRLYIHVYEARKKKIVDRDDTTSTKNFHLQGQEASPVVVMDQMEGHHDDGKEGNDSDHSDTGSSQVDISQQEQQPINKKFKDEEEAFGTVETENIFEDDQEQMDTEKKDHDDFIDREKILFKIIDAKLHRKANDLVPPFDDPNSSPPGEGSMDSEGFGANSFQRMANSMRKEGKGSQLIKFLRKRLGLFDKRLIEDIKRDTEIVSKVDGGLSTVEAAVGVFQFGKKYLDSKDQVKMIVNVIHWYRDSFDCGLYLRTTVSQLDKWPDRVWETEKQHHDNQGLEISNLFLKHGGLYALKLSFEWLADQSEATAAVLNVTDICLTIAYYDECAARMLGSLELMAVFKKVLSTPNSPSSVDQNTISAAQFYCELTFRCHLVWFALCASTSKMMDNGETTQLYNLLNSDSGFFDLIQTYKESLNSS